MFIKSLTLYPRLGCWTERLCLAGSISMPGGRSGDPAVADISSGDWSVWTIGREKEGAMTACCCSWEMWGVEGEEGRQLDTAGSVYGEYLSWD